MVLASTGHQLAGLSFLAKYDASRISIHSHDTGLLNTNGPVVSLTVFAMIQLFSRYEQFEMLYSCDDLFGYLAGDLFWRDCTGWYVCTNTTDDNQAFVFLRSLALQGACAQ